MTSIARKIKLARKQGNGMPLMAQHFDDGHTIVGLYHPPTAQVYAWRFPTAWFPRVEQTWPWRAHFDKDGKLRPTKQVQHDRKRVTIYAHTFFLGMKRNEKIFARDGKFWNSTPENLTTEDPNKQHRPTEIDARMFDWLAELMERPIKDSRLQSSALMRLTQTILGYEWDRCEEIVDEIVLNELLSKNFCGRTFDTKEQLKAFVFGTFKKQLPAYRGQLGDIRDEKSFITANSRDDEDSPPEAYIDGKLNPEYMEWQSYQWRYPTMGLKKKSIGESTDDENDDESYLFQVEAPTPNDLEHAADEGRPKK